jgi:hypothetical protein
MKWILTLLTHEFLRVKTIAELPTHEIICIQHH